MDSAEEKLRAALAARFMDPPQAPGATHASSDLARMAARGSVRGLTDAPVDDALIDTLCAVALAAPTKSDLQQADIVIVRDPAVRAGVEALIDENPWLAGAPALLVVCGNNRRHRRVHELRGHPFVNDHLDAFFNAAVDAGIVLATFVAAAEAAGLGTCPLSAVRNRPDEMSALLALPDHVFPVAGLAVGWPDRPARITPRLPLAATVHVDRHDDGALDAHVAAYDRWRGERRPFARQRDPERFGTVDDYGWSEDKARQYAVPQRPGFGAFVRAKGFRLD